MSATLAWRPPPTDPEPIGTAKHPFLGLMKQAVLIGGSYIDDPLAHGMPIIVRQGDGICLFLQGACEALPREVARHSAQPFDCQHGDQAHHCGHPDYWRVELRREVERFLAELGNRDELLVEVTR